jgi:hypothetical protein
MYGMRQQPNTSLHRNVSRLLVSCKGHLRPVSFAVIPKRKARQSYLFIAEVKHAKMTCLVDEFREVIGDSFQDTSRRKDK